MVYVGSPHDVVAKMLEVAQVKKDDILYDPGCGDGRICVMAAKKYGCKAVGFDLNPVRIRESLENVKRNGVENLVRIERKDIFTVDFSEATVVSMYLLPWMNKKLVPQLQKMKPGTRIVAHDYSIEGYPPDKTITMTLQAGRRGALHLPVDAAAEARPQSQGCERRRRRGTVGVRRELTLTLQ